MRHEKLNKDHGPYSSKYGNLVSIFETFTGIISTTASLDRESKDLYILKVHAHEKGADPLMSSPSQVVVMVTDENDNTPSFDQHEYKVLQML